MTIIFVNNALQHALVRIAKSLESIDETLKKISQDDFQSEDEMVKQMSSDVEAATQRVPGQ